MGQFPVPDKPMQIAYGSGKMPSIEVMLIPLSGQGSLETLCVKYLKKSWPGYADVHKAANKYLTTSPIDISDWGEEKQSKSHFQCMIAGKHKDDPTMSVYGAFDRDLIDPKDSVFHPIRDKIKAFAESLP